MREGVTCHVREQISECKQAKVSQLRWGKRTSECSNEAIDAHPFLPTTMAYP